MKRMPDRLAAPVRFIRRIASFRVPLYAANASFYLVLSVFPAILLVLASALLTGFNIYPSLVKWGGAGALVPITGFANSVAAPAIEFQKEGQVFGIGCKIFTIAGPVILYGIFVSWVLGLIGWIGSLL